MLEVKPALSDTCLGPFLNAEDREVVQLCLVAGGIDDAIICIDSD